MSDKEIFSLIEQASDMGITKLVFSGGEPLIRPGIRGFLKYTVEKDLKVTLLTNGLLIDDATAYFLKDLGVRVKISLDGTSAVTHDYLRGKGSYLKTLEVLRKLSLMGLPDLTVHYTVNRLNLAELADLPALLTELGVPNMVIGTIKPSGRARINKELLIPPSMVAYVNQKASAIVNTGNIPVVQFTDRGWGEFGCPAVCNKMGITAGGRFGTCVFFSGDMLKGSIRESSLIELWESYINGPPDFTINEICSTCSDLERCAGGCRARAIYYQGDKNAPDPYACALHEKKVFINSHRKLLKALI